MGVLKYKEYTGSVEYSEEDDMLYGKVLGINALFLYEGKDLDELKTDFHDVIDEYLEECKDNGDVPMKPYKGSFNVRVGQERHMNLDIEAKEKGISMNALICDIIDKHYAVI